MTAIPKKLRQLVDRELEPGESIDWIEQPIPQFFNTISTIVFLFAIPWTAFSIFWICAAANFRFPEFQEGIEFVHFFPLFGVPFVLVGLVMLSTPLWVWLSSLHTIYVITNYRAILFQGGVRNIAIKSFFPDELDDILRRERGNNIGDVIISLETWTDSDGDEQTLTIGFHNIRNPREVEKKLKALAETLSGLTHLPPKSPKFGGL